MNRLELIMSRYTLELINSIKSVKTSFSDPFPTEFNKPVIGVDRDGVIAEWKQIIKTPNDFKPIPGALESILRMRQLGHRVIVFSDQPSIYRNKLTPQEVDIVNEYMFKLLGEIGCQTIDGLYYNTSEEATDVYAKPNLGMVRRAERETGVDFSKGYIVGDSLLDVKMALNAKAVPVLILTGQGLEAQEKLKKINLPGKDKVQIYSSLKDFVLTLEQE